MGTEECAAQVFDLGVCLDGDGNDGVDSDSESDSTSLSSRIDKDDQDDNNNDNCYQCIYLLTTVQLSDIDRCLEYCDDSMGDNCNQEATALVNCGNNQNRQEENSLLTTPTTILDTDPAPVPDSTDPVPVPVPADAVAAADFDIDIDTDTYNDTDTDVYTDAVTDNLSSFVDNPTT